MNPTIIIIIFAVILAAGALFLWLFFRRVNKKYIVLFERLSELARRNPQGLQQQLAGKSSDSEKAVELLGQMGKINKVDIIKAGKDITRLHVHASMAGQSGPVLLYVELHRLESGDWNIATVTVISGSPDTAV